jgi:prophage regulatory protein
LPTPSPRWLPWPTQRTGRAERWAREPLRSTLLSFVNPTIRRMDGGLVGVAEIASLLSVSRQRVDALLKSHRDFPRPIAELSAGRIWHESEIIEWAKATGRMVS